MYLREVRNRLGMVWKDFWQNLSDLDFQKFSSQNIGLSLILQNTKFGFQKCVSERHRGSIYNDLRNDFREYVGSTFFCCKNPFLQKKLQKFSFSGVWAQITIFGYFGLKIRFGSYLDEKLSSDCD